MFDLIPKRIRARLPGASIIALVVAIALVCFLFAAVCAYAAGLLDRSDIRVVYSLDKRENDQEIIRLINNADEYVYFAVYYFTEQDIADALIRAKDRGVTVWGITNAEAATTTNSAVIERLRAAGIPVETQRHLDGIMHMKVLVTDEAYASGSYNWTEAATDANDEVLEIGSDESVRQQYLAIVEKVLIANE